MVALLVIGIKSEQHIHKNDAKDTEYRKNQMSVNIPCLI